MHWILAQIADPAAPVQGWASVVLQGGAFGLLTYIVAVLSPKMLKDARDERNAREESMSKLIDTLQARFDARSNAIVASIQQQTTALREGIDNQGELITGVLHTICRAAPAVTARKE